MYTGGDTTRFLGMWLADTTYCSSGIKASLLSLRWSRTWKNSSLEWKNECELPPRFPTRRNERSNGFCATGDVMLRLWLYLACAVSATEWASLGDDRYSAYHFYNLVCSSYYSAIRNITRLDGARGKKQVCRPHVRTEVFRKQIYCIEESTCDTVGTFRHLGIVPACPPSFFCKTHHRTADRPASDYWHFRLL